MFQITWVDNSKSLREWSVQTDSAFKALTLFLEHHGLVWRVFSKAHNMPHLTVREL